MTRFVGQVDEQNSESAREELFEVDCATLDELAGQFTERRISLLKVDVGGYEMEVLAGAKELFKDQKVDLLYIEAGVTREYTPKLLSPDRRSSGQPCLSHVFEQKNEWLEDSQVLRRTNVFLSEQ